MGMAVMVMVVEVEVVVGRTRHGGQKYILIIDTAETQPAGKHTLPILAHSNATIEMQIAGRWHASGEMRRSRPTFS